jgi:hypothetical protein
MQKAHKKTCLPVLRSLLIDLFIIIIMASEEQPRKSALKSRSSSAESGKEPRRSSFTDMDEKSIVDLATAVSVKKKLGSEGVQWSDSVCSKRISILRKSCYEDMFYTSNELSEFRHEAFMEECGLDPSDFD